MGLKHKKRVLISIDWFLPGYKAGGPIQSCANLIAHLKDEFDFYVITRNTDYNSEIPYEGVTADAWQITDAGVHVYYFSTGQLSYRSLKKVICETQFDLLYINGVFSKYFSLMPLVISKRYVKSPVLIAARGMFAPGAVRVKPLKKKLFFMGVKLLKLYKNTVFHATNEVEAQQIKNKLGERTGVKVAPNLPKVNTGAQLSSHIPKEKGILKLISVARISPEKNTKYALQLLKSIKTNGKVIFDIYGPINDHFYWDACKDIINQLPDNIVINHLGSLKSELVEQTLRQYHFLFLPTKGENFGHIIVESLLAGVPVVISDQTPWRNLQASQVGWDISLADTAKFLSILEICVDLDNAAYQELCRNTQDYLKDKLMSEEIINQNRNLFLEGA